MLIRAIKPARAGFVHWSPKMGWMGCDGVLHLLYRNLPDKFSRVAGEAPLTPLTPLTPSLPLRQTARIRTRGRQGCCWQRPKEVDQPMRERGLGALADTAALAFEGFVFSLAAQGRVVGRRRSKFPKFPRSLQRIGL